MYVELWLVLAEGLWSMHGELWPMYGKPWLMLAGELRPM